MMHPGDFMYEKLCRNMHRNSSGWRKRQPELDEDVAGWLEGLRKGGPAALEAAGMWEQFALGRVVTKEQSDAMWARLHELDSDL